MPSGEGLLKKSLERIVTVDVSPEKSHDRTLQTVRDKSRLLKSAIPVEIVIDGEEVYSASASTMAETRTAVATVPDSTIALA